MIAVCLICNCGDGEVIIRYFIQEETQSLLTDRSCSICVGGRVGGWGGVLVVTKT